MVPTMFSLFAEAEDGALLKSCRDTLQYLVAGGEAVPPKLALRCREIVPGSYFTNSYGPTETSIGVSEKLFDPATDVSSFPIGVPIDNSDLYIMDSAVFSNLPDKTYGELFIAGRQLAHGYLRRPSLTAQKFLPDPYAAQPGMRMYSSGDLCRRSSGGNVEYLRRIDFQVKVRGFRIELGEIEACLMSHQLVRQAFVTVVHSPDGAPRLVAYVILAPGSALTSDALRKHAEAELTHYMVPSFFVFMDTFPYTSSGKLNRSALPDPTKVTTSSTVAFSAPRNHIELALSKIWCSVLSLDSVGIHDDFFSIGGDSITSIQIVSKARASGYSIGVKDVLSCRTLAKLAECARLAEPTRASPQPSVVSGAISPTRIMKWFASKTWKNRNRYNQSQWFDLGVNVPHSTLVRALQTVMDNHPMLRLSL
eukprot:TRINITY_DN5256_c0_g1_i1.p1 TRINITY_DN5256_c0_g1~~TRINITY_DN5256_c0_g1_i1.p1  ORF type:complete len:422 (-),score=52.88 TRINITY_DN5256_c0_g1_i1:65-1330(-)